MSDELNSERFLSRLKRLHTQWTKGECREGGREIQGVSETEGKEIKPAMFAKLQTRISTSGWP